MSWGEKKKKIKLRGIRKKFLNSSIIRSSFRVLDAQGIQMCRDTCCLDAVFVLFFLCLIDHACHTATHNTEEDNSKHVVNRSETMTLRKEGEIHDQCLLITM